MEKSLLYELLMQSYIYDYRNELEKEENDNLSKWLREAREVLEKNLTAEQLKLVQSFEYRLNSREEYIDFQTGIRILNYGVKIGMELQKAFDNLAESE